MTFWRAALLVPVGLAVDLLALLPDDIPTQSIPVVVGSAVAGVGILIMAQQLVD